MRSVMQWLVNVEDLAQRFYARASRLPLLELEFQTFLAHLAEDEAWHRKVMTAALAACDRGDLPQAAVVVDVDTDQRVRGTFLRNMGLLENGRLTRDDVVHALITAELSEWNNLFLYAVRSMEQVEFEVKAIGARMQRHIGEIEQHLEGFPEGRQRLKALEKLSPVWLPRALVVDDQEPLALLLQDFLEGECRTDVALSGERGLELPESDYFNVVISDVRMAPMDGLEFFRRATERFPSLRDRFLFVSGNCGDAQAEQIRALDIPLLAKPFQVSQLLHAVRARVATIATRPPGEAAVGT